jgi:thiosulfate/3-mercaptopyruvate sulfurtransferase
MGRHGAGDRERRHRDHPDRAARVTGGPRRGYIRRTMHTTLIDTATLAAHLDDPNWAIVDCRFDLANPHAGRAQYARSHIPGARYLSIEDDLSAPKTGTNGRHPLPTPERFAQVLGAAGIGNDSQVVVYDGNNAAFAGRLWWMLRWIGHDRVAVLDGGYAQWLKDDHPETADLPAVTPRTFVPRPRPMTVDTAWLAARLRDPALRVVDARAANRYRGENETIDPVAGHIPGSMNRPFAENLDATGRMKPADALAREWRELLGGLPPEALVHSCGSGVSACHNLLAMEIAGLRGGRLYPGSWSEWCADPARPVATGPEP